MLLLGFVFVVTQCFKLKHYESDGDFVIHTNPLLQSQNEGGNTELFLDDYKIIGLEFDFDEDFDFSEILEAKMIFDVKDTFGESRLKICAFMENPKEGDGSFYGRDISEYADDVDGEGPTFLTNDGEEWDFLSLIDCNTQKKFMVGDMYKGHLEVDITDLLKEMAQSIVPERINKGRLVVMKKKMKNTGFRCTLAAGPSVDVKLKGKGELFGPFKEPKEWRVYMTPEDLAYIIDDPIAEEYAHCDVSYDGGIFHQNAGCRFKGGDSTLNGCLIRNPDGTYGPLNTDKCRKLSFKIDTYEFRDDKWKIYGQKKINLVGLEAIMSDFSEDIGYDQMSNAVGAALYNQAGLITERFRYATLYVNDEYWGLYLMLEQVDDKFTEHRFAEDDNEGEGALWKEAWWNKRTPDYFEDHQEEGKTEDNEFILSVANMVYSVDMETEGRDFLETYFDVNSILTTLAATTLIGNYDSFQLQKCVKWFPPGTEPPGCLVEDYGSSNTLLYRYQLGDVDKLVVIPRDLDNVGIGDEYIALDNWYQEIEGDLDPENFEQTEKWYVDDPMCEDGKISYLDPVYGIVMRHLPAQCDPFFIMLKMHYWDEYVKIFYQLAETVMTEENVDFLIDEFYSIIRSYVRNEPSGIPEFGEWKDRVEDFGNRIISDIHQAVSEMDVLTSA